MTDRASRRAVGAHYEEEAARYLEQQGYQILERNFFSRYGEIDLIAKDEDTLVFVEVKYRKTKRAGYALEAIDSRKAGQVRRVAAVYLYEHGFPESAACRFDAVGIDGEQITHLINAF